MLTFLTIDVTFKCQKVQPNLLLFISFWLIFFFFSFSIIRRIYHRRSYISLERRRPGSSDSESSSSKVHLRKIFNWLLHKQNKHRWAHLDYHLINTKTHFLSNLKLDLVLLISKVNFKKLLLPFWWCVILKFIFIVSFCEKMSHLIDHIDLLQKK